MKLIQLQYFEVICKHNSFTKASEELHVSQPTLSVAINDLEKEFGVTLFYRQRNGLRITEDGEKLLELSKTVTVPAENLIAEMKGRGEKDQAVTIGLPAMIGSIVFPKIFPLLREQYPSTKVTIIESPSPEAVELICDGKLDAAIIAADRPLPSAADNVDVCEIPILFYISIEDPLAYMTELDYEKAADVPLALIKKKTTLCSFVDEEYKKRGLTPNVILNTSNLYTIRNLLENRSAATFLFKGILDNGEENIVSIPLPGNPTTPVKLIWNKNHHQSTGLKNLIKLIKNNHITV